MANLWRLLAACCFLWAALALPARAARAVPETVVVGVYVNQVPELDVRTNTFLVDFYLWFRWKGPLDPTHSFEFMNAMDRTNLWKEAAYKDAAGNDRPETLPDGRRYQEFHVQGRFAQPYLLANYPLDKQQMAIAIEDKLYDAGKLHYAADTTGTKVRPDVSVPGWIFQGFVAQSNDFTYDTTFGDPSATDPDAQRYSRVTFSLQVVRPMGSVMAKTVLPLLIVLMITFSAMLLKSRDIDARATLTITALISAVALHYSDMTELPPTGYLTLLDEIYILAYSLIFAATVLCIVSYRLAIAGHEQGARRLDWGALAGLLLVALSGGFAILHWH